jgi:hypothetical protein
MGREGDKLKKCLGIGYVKDIGRGNIRYNLGCMSHSK